MATDKSDFYFENAIKPKIEYSVKQGWTLRQMLQNWPSDISLEMLDTKLEDLADIIKATKKGV